MAKLTPAQEEYVKNSLIQVGERGLAVDPHEVMDLLDDKMLKSMVRKSVKSTDVGRCAYYATSGNNKHGWFYRRRLADSSLLYRPAITPKAVVLPLFTPHEVAYKWHTGWYDSVLTTELHSVRLPAAASKAWTSIDWSLSTLHDPIKEVIDRYTAKVAAEMTRRGFATWSDCDSIDYANPQATPTTVFVAVDVWNSPVGSYWEAWYERPSQEIVVSVELGLSATVILPFGYSSSRLGRQKTPKKPWHNRI